MKDVWQFILMSAAAIWALFCGLIVGKTWMKEEAVMAGKAEYLITEKGTKIWRWKP